MSRPTRGFLNVDWHIRSEVTTIVLPLSLARMIWSENIARHGSVRLNRERLLVVDTKSTSIESSAVLRMISKMSVDSIRRLHVFAQFFLLKLKWLI